MRYLDPAITSHLAARGSLHVHVLVWIAARDRDTGEMEAIGLWTGDDHQEVMIGAQSRTYYGAGGLIGIDPVTARAGLEVREHRITLSPLAEEVTQAIRIYDPYLAPIEVHEWYFDPATLEPLADPIRIFKGHVTGAPITTPAAGGDASCEITAVSSAWTLTRSLTLKRSDEALRARAAADRFRRYTDISGSVECAWGEKRASAPVGSGRSTAPTPKKTIYKGGTRASEK